MTFVLFTFGLILLALGAEILVNGATRLAAAARISPLVIGLTIVAFGTSSPELAVGLQASLRNESDIVMGNVIGSNIFNILLVLGITALIAPLFVSTRLRRVDVPIMVGISFVMFFMALDGRISQPDGLILFAGIIIYIIWSVLASRRENAHIAAEYAREYGIIEQRGDKHWIRNLGMVVVGVALLTLGSHWLVEGAVAFARLLGVSELIIGLTIVAIGTSLPEVAASVVATIHGERDISVGNVVGSNIFNILSVLGPVSLITPGGVAVPSGAVAVDIPIMIAVACLCLPIFFTGNVITRWEGILLTGYYVAYTLYLILHAGHSMLLPYFTTAMILLVIPATIVLLAMSVRIDRQRRKRVE